MLMMCPPPWRIMAGRTARQQRNAARAFTPMTRSNLFGGVSRMPAQCRAPALLIRMSICPNRSMALATMPSIWPASRTSTCTGRALAPTASTSAATLKIEPGSFSVDSVLFAAMTTSQPSLASPRAMARPIPRLAPVTMATRPLSDGMMLLPAVGGTRWAPPGFSPEGAAANSQGWSAEPLEFDVPIRSSPEGAAGAEWIAPLGLHEQCALSSRGSASLHPWLLTAAPSGLNPGSPKPAAHYSRGRAAVHDEHLPGHERGLVGRQVECHVADLVGLADAGHRLFGFESGAVAFVLPEVLAEIGLDQAGGDGVHADAVRSKLARPGPRHHDQAGLREA